MELGSLVGSRTRDAFIGIQTGELPLLVGSDHLGIDLHLIGVGCELFFAVGGHSAVGCHSLLAMLCFVDYEGLFRLDERYCFLWDFGYSHYSFSPSVISVPTLVWILTFPELESVI